MKLVPKKSLAGKLGIRPGARVALLHSPRGYTSILGAVPRDVSFATRLAGEPFDLVQGFYEDRRSLKVELGKLKKSVTPQGRIWVCWRKGNVTELGRAAIHELGEKAGLHAVAECAVDAEWSAMRLMPPKLKRKITEKRRKS